MQQNAREEYTDEAFGRSEASKKRPKETEKKATHHCAADIQ